MFILEVGEIGFSKVGVVTLIFGVIKWRITFWVAMVSWTKFRF